ncbi:hypothetical protein HID58_011421, partial [Brassica napus]
FSVMMGSHGGSLDTRTYNILLDSMCCKCKVEKTLMIFEYMRKREMDVSIVDYTIIVQGMRGLVHEADALFRKLTE